MKCRERWVGKDVFKRRYCRYERSGVEGGRIRNREAKTSHQTVAMDVAMETVTLCTKKR